MFAACRINVIEHISADVAMSQIHFVGQFRCVDGRRRNSDPVTSSIDDVSGSAGRICRCWTLGII